MLTLQSLNVNLQKQVEELQSETDRQTRDMAELRASLDALNADKHNMQDIFMKMVRFEEKKKFLSLQSFHDKSDLTKKTSAISSTYEEF